MPEWNERVDQNAKTLIQEPQTERAESAPKRVVSTQNSVFISANPEEKNSVGEQRESTKWKVLRTIGFAGLFTVTTSAGIGMIAYAFAPEKFAEIQESLEASFKKMKNGSEKPSATEPSAIASAEVLPPPEPTSQDDKMPVTPKELMDLIKKKNKRVNPESFQRKQMNMNGLMFAEVQNDEGDKTWVWKKVEDVKSDAENILIATKIEKPDSAKFISYPYAKPFITVEDDQDPRIQYHLFGCSDQKDRRKRGAAIVLKQKGKSREILANVDFMVPYCEKKAD